MQQLKCVDCQGYLSQPPIMKHPELGSVCGYCARFVKNKLYVRSVEYEVIATLMEFPCRNKGCRERLLFGHFDEHEDNCLYREYDCPFNTYDSTSNISNSNTNNCDWKGNSSNMRLHFIDTHPQFVLSTNSFKLELTKNYEENKLFSINDNLFIVQTKCEMLKCRFWCLIRYIGKSKDRKFKYNLEITANNKKNKILKPFITHEIAVQSDICIFMDFHCAIEVDICSMLTFLNIPDSLTCTFHIV